MAEIRVLEFDRDSNEAIVEIATTISTVGQPLFDKSSNATLSLILFACTVDHWEYNSSVSLFGFLVTNIVSEKCLRPPVKTDVGLFSYHIYAKVQDSHKRHVRLGDIHIYLDTPIPKDIVNDDLVSFDVQRLDFTNFLPDKD